MIFQENLRKLIFKKLLNLMGLFLLFALMLSVPGNLAADTIFLRNGEIFRGSISGISGSSVSIQTAEGSKSFSRRQIKRIVYGPWSREDELEKKKKEEDERRKKQEQERKKQAERIARQKALEEELKAAEVARQKIAEEKARQEALEKRIAVEKEQRIKEQQAELEALRKKQEEEERALVKNQPEVKELVQELEKKETALSAEQAEIKSQTSAIETAKPSEPASNPEKETEAKINSAKKEEKKAAPDSSVTAPEKSQSMRPESGSKRWNWALLAIPGLARYKQGDKTAGATMAAGSLALLGYSTLAYQNFSQERNSYKNLNTPMLALFSGGSNGFLFNYIHFKEARQSFKARASELNAGLALLGGLYGFHLYDYLSNFHGTKAGAGLFPEKESRPHISFALAKDSIFFAFQLPLAD